MALTYTVIRQGIDDNRRFVEADVQFSNPYVVGGETVTLPGSVGLKEVRAVRLVYTVYPDGGTTASATHGRQVVPDLTSPTVPKLKLFVSNNTESGAVDQTQVIQRMRFIGS